MTEKDKNDLLVKVADRVESIHKAIYGNGRAGLLDRVSIVETQQKNCPARNRKYAPIVQNIISALMFIIGMAMLIIAIL